MRRSLLLLAALCACAPSQRRLLAARHYPEAIDGVEVGALDGAAVLARIAADLELGAHLEVVPADAVRAQLPGAPVGLDGLALVRTIHDAHRIPIERLDVAFVLLQAGAVAPTPRITIDALAQYTGEALPDPTVVHHPDESSLQLVRPRRPWLGMIARVVVNIATVGLIHPIVPIVERRGTPAYTEVREPDADAYARQSPAAESLRRWLTPPACDGRGARCERYLLWSRDVAAPLELVVVARLAPYRPPAITYRIPLPPGPLDEALRRTFGDRVRTLAELARAAGTRPTVSYTLDLAFDVGGGLASDARARLCKRVRGTRRVPGLRAQPGLRFTLEIGAADADQVLRAVQVRDALVACGVDLSKIAEADAAASLTLRVEHEIPN